MIDKLTARREREAKIIKGNTESQETVKLSDTSLDELAGMGFDVKQAKE